MAARAEPFRSQIRAIIKGRTAELERLAVEMYAGAVHARHCTVHLRLPRTHRQAMRTTERRRSNTIPHAFGERAVLQVLREDERIFLSERIASYFGCGDRI